MSGLMRKDLYAELTQVEDSHWWHQQKRQTTLVLYLIKLFGKLELAVGLSLICLATKEKFQS